MKKYNVKEIMIQAHDIRKAEGVTMGAALKKAWSVAKLTVGANPMDDKVQEYFKRLEAADTNSGLERRYATRRKSGY